MRVWRLRNRKFPLYWAGEPQNVSLSADGEYRGYFENVFRGFGSADFVSRFIRFVAEDGRINEYTVRPLKELLPVRMRRTKP
jgi:hypothetical protein